MITPPQLPPVVRALNWSGHKLRGLGLPLVSLELSSLLQAARRQTGLGDFGSPPWQEGLQRLLAALEGEAELSLLGRFIARTTLIELLANRLQMQAAHRRHPEMARGEIRRPLFIVGLPRTGTSILHELLAQDPSLRTPLSWEVARPCPPPERATYRSDPRIAAVDASLARTDRLIPSFKQVHPMGALLPQECVAMMAHDFVSLFFTVIYRIPSYTQWLLEQADLAPVYRSHRRQAQLLQWRCPGQRWVFKSPGHLWSLPALLAEYPDARLVHTHRDPIRVLSSMTSLCVVVRSMAGRRVESAAIAREWSAHLGLALERGVEARASGLVPAARVMDVRFDQLMADTIGTVRKIYQWSGMTLSEPAEAAMRRFLAANPADKHGRHRYRFADTGLDLATERRRVAPYQSYFDVPTEASDP